MGKKLTIEEVKIRAKEKGFECLSDVYINSKTKLEYKCSKGHIWKTRPSFISYGYGCPYCAKNIRLTIDVVKKRAKEKGFECLSTQYINNNTKLKYKCSKGHIWFSRENDIYNGNGCPDCAKTKRLTIEYIKEKTKLFGFECLSNTYVNNKTHLKFKCPNGHTWKTSAQHILTTKSGCPYCNVWKREKICTKIFNKISFCKFKKIRPKWLNRMELDGYNKTLNIAFEHNGEQHYKHCPKFFNQTKKQFNDLQERDKLKVELCKKHGVKLIVIPYTIKEDKIEEYIKKQLISFGVL